MGHVLYVQQSEHVLYLQNHTAHTESSLREVFTLMLLVCTEYIVICVVMMYNAVQHASSSAYYQQITIHSKKTSKQKLNETLKKH
jgi:hypothetical protein